MAIKLTAANDPMKPINSLLPEILPATIGLQPSADVLAIKLTAARELMQPMLVLLPVFRREV